MHSALALEYSVERSMHVIGQRLGAANGEKRAYHPPEALVVTFVERPLMTRGDARRGVFSEEVLRHGAEQVR